MQIMFIKDLKWCTQDITNTNIQFNKTLAFILHLIGIKYVYRHGKCECML